MNNEIRPIDNVNIFRFLSADGTARELRPDDKSDEFVLVWLDENIDTSNDCIETKRQLQHVFNYLKTFTDENTCLDYIKHDDFQNQKIFFIVSGLLAMRMISPVVKLSRIVYIYIFCQIPSDLIPKEDKVRGTFFDKHTLFATLTQDIHQIIKNLTEMSVFCIPTAQEKSITTVEDEDFNNFQNFLKAIINTNYSDAQSKDEMINQCRCYYRGNEYEQKKIDEFEAAYISKDAVNWYTKDTFIYRLLNKALRTRNMEIVYAFRFFIVDLCREIYELHWQQVQGTHKKITTLYRGQFLPAAELEKLKENIGEKISMNSFLSTSQSSEIALTYSGQGKQRPFLESVVFQIDLGTDEPNCLMPFCSIEDISHFKEENEYLFKVGTVFRLISIDEVLDGVWLIQIKLTNICSHSVYKTVDASKQVLLDFFKPSLTGNIETEDIDELIDDIPSRYRDLMGGYINVGEAYGIEENYFEQLGCYKKALQIYEDVSDSKQPLLRLGYYAITRRLAGHVHDCATPLDDDLLSTLLFHSDHKCIFKKSLDHYEKTISRCETSISPNYHRIIVIPHVIKYETIQIKNLHKYCFESLEQNLQGIEMILNTYCQNQPTKKQSNTNSATIIVLVKYYESENKASETINYAIRTNTTVAAFIESICNSTGWTYKWRLRLVYKGLELRKNATLAECDIQNGAYLIIDQSDIQISLDILNFIRNSNDDTNKNRIQVHIELLSGHTMTISLSSHEEMVQDLKYRIYDYSNIYVDYQRLIYAGRQLEDGRTLSDYNVQNNSTIHLMCRVGTKYHIPSSSIIEENVIETVSEKVDILRRTIQDVRENYNDASFEAKRNALLNLQEKICDFSQIRIFVCALYASVLLNTVFFLGGMIGDCNRQRRLLKETKS